MAINKDVNDVAKRIQTRLSKLGVKVTLGDIRPVVEQMISDFDNPSAEEVNNVIDSFMDNASQLTVIGENIEPIDSNEAAREQETSINNNSEVLVIGGESAIATSDSDADQDYPEQSRSGELTHTANQSQLITTTADQMGIVLDAGEISQIAENITTSSDDFDQDIDQIKLAILAFVEHKALLSQAKINNMINEVRQVVGEKNNENSQLLSDGLRSINSDIQEANKQFKSNVKKCLTAFNIPAIKAG